MSYRSLVTLLPLALALLAAPVIATAESAESAESEPAATEPLTPLTRQEIDSAARIDSVTVPSPGELMTALAKEAKPNWQSEYRPPIPTTFSSRAQIALNVGGLIADGYIALEAEDRQQVKNIGKDIIALAKTLAVSENVIARGSSIADFAENSEWTALKEELEATQNEVKLALEEQHDADLVSLVSLGGWIRGTAVLSSWISENYTPGSAKLLRQPAVVALMRQKLKELPEKTQSDPLIEKISEKLEQIEKLVSFPEDKPPTLDEVKQLKTISNKLVDEISRKKEAK